MVDAALQLRLAVDTYHSDNAEYPPDLAAVASSLPTGTAWPLNPYTNAPITDNRSPAFDPAKSVGTVYYELYYREEQTAGYRMHVFGDKGLLMIFDNSAFGAQ